MAARSYVIPQWVFRAPAGWGQGCGCKAFTHMKAEAMEASQYQGAKEEGWERGRGEGTVVLLVRRDWPDLPVFCC